MRIDQHTSNHVPFNSVSTSGLGEELSRYCLFVCLDLLAQKFYHVTNGQAEALSRYLFHLLLFPGHFLQGFVMVDHS